MRISLITTKGLDYTHNLKVLARKINKEVNIYTWFDEQTEEIYPDYEWNNCNLVTNWIHKSEFASLPKFLIIQLMRFKSNNGITEAYTPSYAYPNYYGYNKSAYAKQRDYSKKNDFVDYPITDLDLTDYCSEVQKSKSCKYDLYGVIHHTGTVYGGHYFATMKNDLDSDEWFKFNGKSLFY